MTTKWIIHVYCCMVIHECCGKPKWCRNCCSNERNRNVMEMVIIKRNCISISGNFHYSYKLMNEWSRTPFDIPMNRICGKLSLNNLEIAVLCIFCTFKVIGSLSEFEIICLLIDIIERVCSFVFLSCQFCACCTPSRINR